MRAQTTPSQGSLSVSEKPSGADDRDRPSRVSEAGQGASADRQAKAPRQAGGLRLYKPSQGYHTRLGTAIGGGLLAVAGAVFVFNELSRDIDPGARYALPVMYGSAVAFMLVMGALLYWIVGLNRKANEFFIATEGEMKKVNWSTRQEIVKSTKVVIFCVVVLSVFLFAADLLFMVLFSAIGVLQGGAVFARLFNFGS